MDITEIFRLLGFSALQRAEIAEMRVNERVEIRSQRVSVLFNEPKLLKCCKRPRVCDEQRRFSALQRAEIAEIQCRPLRFQYTARFSALQRAEIAEIAYRINQPRHPSRGFSALQRAEIAEISSATSAPARSCCCFSALQRAEIAEIQRSGRESYPALRFQCSSTSRNC